MKRKILIADDESRIRIMLRDFLEEEGYEVIEAKDGEEALEQFAQDPDIHLIILDVMMPYLNGWEVCKTIRKTSTVPIIMLTAKNQDSDELEGFKSGTDEYVKKPFNPIILMARVKAMIERIYGNNPIIRRGALILDLDQRTLCLDEKKIDLSQTEFKLLHYLILNENSAISREQLLDHVWGLDYKGSDRTVDTHMNRLRAKFGKDYAYLQTVWGYGYKFEVNP
jgi:DNA-binding response OmpR family regulator